jgi:CRP/FNR family transcriptional regulator, anaerobic regulatory protein
VSRKKDTRVADVIDRIRYLRITKKISIEELATRANLSRSYIYYIETKKKNPTLTVLFQLADAMDADIEDFFDSSSVNQSGCKLNKKIITENKDCNSSNLFRIFSFFNMYQKKGFKSDYLSWKELYLLLSVKQNGSSSISNLAANLEMPVLDISRMVSDLKSRNILQKRINSSDHRVTLSVLTDTGLMLLERHEQNFRAYLESETKTCSAERGETDLDNRFCENSDRLFCSFKPIFNSDDEIVDLEFLRANQAFIREFPKNRSLMHSTLLSRMFYQHFSNILAACNTVWKTQKPVSMILDVTPRNKSYTCKFSRNVDSIVISSESVHSIADEALRELLPYYNYFFSSRPAKMVLECTTGRILEVNEAAVRFYGWSRLQFLEKKIYDISLNSYDVIRSRLMSGGIKSDRSEKIFHVQHRIADGSIKKLEVHISSCLWGETRIQYVTVKQEEAACTKILPDVHEEKKTETKINEDFQAFVSEYESNIMDINELFDHIKKDGRCCYYSAGDHFFEYGTLLPTFGFILDGIFRVYYGTPSGHEYTLEYLHSGDIIDSLSFSNCNPEYEIIIEAVVPCKVIVVDQILFKRRAVVDPHAFEFLYYLEKKRLGRLESRVMLLLTDNAKERYEQFMQSEGEFTRYLRGQDIASYLGITPETLSRIRNTN